MVANECVLCYMLSPENFLENESLSESQMSETVSLPRERTGSTSSKLRLGVAFDPSLGPSEPESSRVSVK